MKQSLRQGAPTAHLKLKFQEINLFQKKILRIFYAIDSVFQRSPRRFFFPQQRHIVFILPAQQAELFPSTTHPSGHTSPIGIPTAETGSLKEIYSPPNPWAKPPFVDSVLLQDLASSHNHDCFRRRMTLPATPRPRTRDRTSCHRDSGWKSR